MAITQTRSKRKLKGGLYIKYRKKRKYELGREPTQTKIGEKRVSGRRIKGGEKKIFLLSCDILNLVGKDGKQIKAKIKGILESGANRHFVRRGILTKGAIVDTDKGKAKIVSRPGQSSSLDAVIVE